MRTRELSASNEALQREIKERRRTEIHLMQSEEKVRSFSRKVLNAREEEKKRVSAALHHDVGSLAVGLSAHFDAIAQDIRAGKPAEALRWMKRARKLFDRSMAGLKDVAVELRPPDLDLLGLRAALRQHFSQTTRRRGVRVRFTENMGNRRVAADVATVLFRIAQEALTNAVRHGRAKRVDVGLSVRGKEVRLTVHDNGKGFDPLPKRGKGSSQIGLRVMREMATAAGGACTVDSAQGKGTTVFVSMPLERSRPRRGGLA
jgi:signal transduction histidine kinase